MFRYTYFILPMLILASCSFWDKNQRLQRAASAGDLKTIQAMLSDSADVNAKFEGGWTPLMFAAYYGKAGAVKLLLSKGADINAKNEDGWTALSRAVFWQRTETKTLKTLIEAGVDVNAKVNRTALLEGNFEGWTALMLVSYQCATLLEHVIRRFQHS